MLGRHPETPRSLTLGMSTLVKSPADAGALDKASDKAEKENTRRSESTAGRIPTPHLVPEFRVRSQHCQVRPQTREGKEAQGRAAPAVSHAAFPEKRGPPPLCSLRTPLSC